MQNCYRYMQNILLKVFRGGGGGGGRSKAHQYATLFICVLKTDASFEH